MSTTPEDPLRAKLLALLGPSHPHDEGRDCGTCAAYNLLVAAPPVAGAEWKDAIRERLAREDWRTADGLSVIVPIGAAEAALRSTAPALDVERLSEAVQRAMTDTGRSVDYSPLAAAIASEYAALEGAE